MVMSAHSSGYRSINTVSLCKPQNPKLLSQCSLVGFTLLFRGSKLRSLILIQCTGVRCLPFSLSWDLYVGRLTSFCELPIQEHIFISFHVMGWSFWEHSLWHRCCPLTATAGAHGRAEALSQATPFPRDPVSQAPSKAPGQWRAGWGSAGDHQMAMS